MTLTVVSKENTNQASSIQKFYEFLAKNPSRLARVLGEPDWKVTATTTTNDTGTVLDLTAEGVTFPADTIRVIRTRTFARGDISDVDKAYHETVTAILGGTTPVVVEASNIDEHGEATYDGATGVIVSTNNVVVQITGVTSVATNWEIHTFVDDLVYISGGQA
jgi:hypothetical protein